jgi:tetratricopeptide (TPR) repeat protein
MRFRPFQLLLPIFAGVLLFEAGCAQQIRASRHLARGNRDIDSGDYDKAENEFQKTLQLDANNSQALGRLGTLYIEEGRILPGFLLLRRAVDTDPDDPDWQLSYGIACLTLGKNAEARAAAEKVLGARPDDQKGLLLLARASTTVRDVEASQHLVDSLRGKNPDAAGYHLASGVFMLSRRDQAGAEKEFRKAAALDPKSAAADGELGGLLVQRGDLKAARDILEQAANLSPWRDPIRLQYVDSLYRTGATAQAKAELDRINKAAPDYLPAWTMAMQLAMRQGRRDEGLADANIVLHRDPINYEALSSRAEIKLAQNDADGALADLQQLASFYHQAPQIKYQMALAYLKKEDLRQAEGSLQQAIILAPRYDEAILLLAEVELRKGNPPAAVDSLTALLKRRPSNATGAFLLAQAYRAEGRVDLALSIFRQLAAVAPKVPTGAYLSGMALTELNRRTEARQAFEESVRIQDNYWPAEEMLVTLDLAEQHGEQAANRVESLQKKYPKAADPWLLHARIQLASKNTAGAESDLLHALSLDPNSHYAYLQLSDLYRQGNRMDQALKELEALTKQRDNAQALMQIGMLSTALGKFDAARDAYRKLLAIDPKFVPALNNLADLESEHLGQLEDALATAKQARTLAPDDPIVSDTLGWTLFLQGKYADAMPFLEESTSKLPEEPEMQYHLGAARYQLDDEGPARISLQAALTASGDFEEKEDARRRLAALNFDPTTADPGILGGLKAKAQANPNDPVLHVRLGAIEARSGAPEQAEADYEAALHVAPQSIPILVALAQLYSGPARNADRARELAKQARGLAPNDNEIAKTLGRALYRTGDFTWSLEVLKDAALQLSNPPDLAMDLALGYFSVGQLSDAAASLKPLLDDPAAAQHQAATRLAALIAASDSPAKALQELPRAQQTLVDDPANLPARLVCALALEQKTDYLGAQSAYEQLLTQYPSFAPAMRELAILDAERLGNDGKAEELAAKARPIFPDDPRLPFELGTISYRRADYANAINYLQQSIHLGETPDALYYLGMAHYQTKDTADAKDELQRALDANLSGENAEQAKRVLEEFSQREISDTPH